MSRDGSALCCAEISSSRVTAPASVVLMRHKLLLLLLRGAFQREDS